MLHFHPAPVGGDAAVTASPSGCRARTPVRLSARPSTPAVWRRRCMTPPPPAGLPAPPRGYSSHLGHKRHVNKRHVWFMNKHTLRSAVVLAAMWGRTGSKWWFKLNANTSMTTVTRLACWCLPCSQYYFSMLACYARLRPFLFHRCR